MDDPQGMFPVVGAVRRFPLSTYIKKKYRGRSPGDVPARNNGSPQGASAFTAYVVLPVLLLEKEMIRIVEVFCTVVAAFLQNGFSTAWASEKALPQALWARCMAL